MGAESTSSLLLIALVLVGSIVTWSEIVPIFRLRGDVLVVESAEAQVSPTEAVVAMNVKNGAQKQLRVVRLMVNAEGLDMADFNVDLPPGCTYAIILRNPIGRWTAGETKNAIITAVFADGSTASATASIKIHGSGWTGIESRPQEESQPNPPSEPNPENQPPPQGSDQPAGRIVIFTDDFKNGLSGWQPWGSAAKLSVEVDMHGRPSPALHVFATGQEGTLAGAAKSVDVSLSSPATLQFTFNYNVKALKDKKGVFPGNLWVRVLGSSGTLAEEKVYEANSADSGWKNATVTIPPVVGRVTVIVYMQILSSKQQDFWIDNVMLFA